MPQRIDYVSRGATTLPRGSVSITVTAEALSSPRQAAREVEVGFAYAMSCDDTTAALGPSDSALRARALLDGWLQHQLGTVEPGSYPSDEWDALGALPPQAQRTTLQRMFEEVWRCRQDIRGLS